MSRILLVAVAGSAMAKSQLLKTSQEKGNRSPTDAFWRVLYFMAILRGWGERVSECVCVCVCVWWSKEELLLDEDCDAVDGKDAQDDQCVGEGQFVVEWREIGTEVGWGRVVRLALPRIVVAVEQHRVLHEVPLQSTLVAGQGEVVGVWVTLPSRMKESAVPFSLTEAGTSSPWPKRA